MPKIDRRNILELIGKNRYKYHSCILTCYNFDFSFFEERVLPILRTANIKNVNILADGECLDHIQEMTTGKEFKYNKTYNFLPVYEKGAFHPKIMFLTGYKQGLLIIGSGNITSSGLNTNDEIWGAFHLNTIDNENAGLFADVWKYLQNFINNNYGFLPQKIDWIKKYSPWLGELPQTSGLIQLNSLNQNIQFLSNNSDQSIYQQLVASVSAENLTTITVVSPYYDKGGGLLKQLLNDFNPETFNCIVDTNSGLLPTDLDHNERERINFYNWRNCTEDDNSNEKRLHAKFFHFLYNDNSEIMLLGSANASMAGMGGRTTKAANAEAGVLISRKQSGNWLKDLNIKLPDTTINISNYPNIKGINGLGQKKNHYPYRIFYSELKGNEITCYTNKEIDEALSLIVLSRQGVIKEKKSISVVEKVTTCKILDNDVVFKVYLANVKGERVSNYSITHRLEMLLRCNPDPTQEKFDALLEQDYPNGEGLTSLLEYVDYDWADEDSESRMDMKKTSGGRNSKDKEIEKEKTYKVLTKDEFNSVNTEIIMKQSGLLTSTNVKLADFLNMVMSDNSLKETDYNESEEQKLMVDEEQKGEGSDVKSKSQPKAIALKEKSALINYLCKLDRVYTDKLNSIYKAKALTVTPDDPITIKSISKILIALQLVHNYYPKKFINQEDENDETTLKEEKFLIEGMVNDKSDTVKGFLLNTFGKFLLLSTAGYKRYEYDILNEKIEDYRQQVFEKALILIFNISWKTDEETKYRLSLLLNLHYYIVPKKIFDKQWVAIIKERADNLLKTNKKESPYSTENLEYYFEDFLPYYLKWIDLFEGPDKQQLIKEGNSINLGDVIFIRKIGFNHIHQILSRNPNVFDFKREGYEMSEKGFIFERLTCGNKFIHYL